MNFWLCKNRCGPKGWIGLFFTCLAFGSVGCQRSRPQNTRVSVVQKRDLSLRLHMTGTIEPKKKATVVAPYEGYVKKLFVQVGQNVKAGDRLVTVSQSLVSGGVYFPLRAPFAGTVVRVSRAEGEFVGSDTGKKEILRVDDLSELLVMAMASEVNTLKIKEGQKATVKLIGNPFEEYEGLVTGVSLAAKENEQWSYSKAVQYPVRIVLPKADQEGVRPGMSANVEIIAEERQQVLSLPHECIEFQKGKNFVVLVGGERKEIQVGLRSDRFAEVQGLQEGDQVRQVDFYKEEM